MRDTKEATRIPIPVWALALLAVALSTVAGLFFPVLPAAAEGPRPPRPEAPMENQGKKGDVAELDQHFAEGRFAAAAELAARLRAEALQRRDEAAATTALIREVQARVGLGATEEAVALLLAAPAPAGRRERLQLQLFRGETLSRYLDAYSWEVRQREYSGPAERLELSRWTAEQLGEAIVAAFAEAFEGRAEWDAESVAPLSGLLEQNDYPARIRGTLRDTLSYLFADALGDASRFSPREANEIYRLSLDRLLAPPAPAALGAILAPGQHPLERMVLVLSDLEAWHLAAGRPEAALEARLTRLDYLRNHFSGAAERARFDRELESLLEAFPPGLEWKAAGLVRLAEWRRQEASPDALIRAHAAAAAAFDAFPGSLGGRQARALLDQLEAPSFALTAMLADGPGLPSLTVAHTNLERLHFRAYRLDDERQRSFATMFRSEAKALAELVRSAKPFAEWQAELGDPGDYRQHQTHLTPPLNELGTYVIVASQRQGFELEQNRAQAVQLVLTDLVALGRPHFATYATEVDVRFGRDGRPVPGARVDLYASSGARAYAVAESRTTGADGLAPFDLGKLTEGSQVMVGVSRGQDHLFTGGWMQRPYLSPPAEQGELRTLLFTDRAVYRPGQKLLFKVIAYREDPRSRERRVEPDAELRVDLQSPNGEEVGIVTLRTGKHGSAAGELAIPTGRGLGAYSLRCQGYWLQVRVEEYQRPTFELELAEPATPLRLNQEARVGGSARYYFGMPLREGEVRWRVVRRPRYPWWWFLPSSYATQQVAAGSGRLDAEGRFEVAFLPRADEALAAGPGGRDIAYAYEVSAELTDEGGETRSATRTFLAGFVAIEATLEPAAGFFHRGEKLEVALRRFDLDGKGRSGKGSWRLLRIADREPLLPAALPLERAGDGADKKLLPGDLERPRWDLRYDEAQAWRQLADGKEVAHGEIVADAAGEARWTFDPAQRGGLAPGLYRLCYRTADPYGAEIERSRELLIGDAIPELPLALVLAARQERLAPGGRLEILAGGGLSGVPAVLEIFRGEERLLRREIEPGKTVVLDREIAGADRGGLTVELTAVARYQIVNLRREIEIPFAEPTLAVSYETFRDRLRPGQRERFTLAVRSRDGQSLDPHLVEILAGMYDRSLDLFAPHPAAAGGDLFASGYGRQRILPQYSSIRAAYTFWRVEPPYAGADAPRPHGDRLTFYDEVMIGGPGGGGPPRMRLMMKAGAAPEAMMMASAAPESPPMAPPPPPPPGPVQGGRAADSAAPPGGAAPPPELRANFAETAFFEPHLEPGDDGRVSFEATLPDAVTEWQLFTHALADDFRYGSDLRRARTVKELLVRPYLPRFLREGDRAELRVSIENTAAAGTLEGLLDLELQDEQGASLLAELGLDEALTRGQAFTVAAGHSTVLRFALAVPRRIGPVVLRVAGRARLVGGAEEVELADGERRLLPILPSRLHLAQSRFAVLSGPSRRQLLFEDLRRNDDPSRRDEKMVVTLDGQLFTSVLRALPYLVDYPYRCTEQNLNRYLSSGILASLYGKYPAIARLAAQLAQRDTPLEPLPAADPNRQILLEESPWLAAARGGEADDHAVLQRVLDPRVAEEVRAGALAELRQAQDPSGGFPWWPGGRPSEFFTLYLLQGFARATEFGVETPRDLVENAWGFLRRELEPELARLKDPKQMAEAVYTITWLNYVLSTYPDLGWTGGAFAEEDRAAMLEASLRRFKELPPRLRLYLASTAHRAGRDEEARRLLESVMDNAKTTPEEGTFWLPEARAWLFYWDRIETHALALRVLSEIAPEDPRRHGLLTWLMLNKKLNQWSSTRSTAEVLYSLAVYLEKEGQLGQPQKVTVELGGRREEMVFAPESTENRRQLEIPGPALEPRRDAAVGVELSSPGLLFASATWLFSTEKLPAEAAGDFFAVRRRFFRRSLEGEEYRLAPLAEGAKIAVGDELEVELEIAAKAQAEYVHLRDPRGAGFEPVELVSGWRWDLGIVHYREIRDSATNFFFETLPPGKMTLRYRLRATTAGSFRVGPATLESMYAPEFKAYSAGEELEIAP